MGPEWGIYHLNWVSNSVAVKTSTSKFFSVDQTTRIHGPSHVAEGDRETYWRELARPQVHGYNLFDAQFLDSLRFASIADEKVVRIFNAPKGFVMMLNALQTVTVPSDIVRRLYDV